MHPRGGREDHRARRTEAPRFAALVDGRPRVRIPLEVPTESVGGTLPRGARARSSATSTVPDFLGQRFGLTKPGVQERSRMSQEKDGREEETGMEAAERQTG